MSMLSASARLNRHLASKSGANLLQTRALSTPASLPAQADAVIIGGGSVGASTLYHLQKKGVNAVLLERHQLTAGTTWHSAGMLWRLRPSHIDIELQTYTREMCIKLEEETEVASWTENGGLFIANNKERFDEYLRLHETGKRYGIDSRILAPEEINEVHPLLRTDDVYGGIYSPTDGTIDPTGIVNAYAKAAKRLGAQIFENTGVADIKTTDPLHFRNTGSKTVQSVVTECGQEIKTPVIINACGAWANEISNMVGVDLPLLAMKHAMVVTESMEGMNHTLPNTRDHDLSIYLKTQGDSMCIGGYEQNPEFWHGVDPNFSFGLFDLDWDTFAQNLDGHMQRCPQIETAGIKSTVCGPESFTPDHKALVGSQPGVHGFFQACGFNSMGMMLGGGMGRELAQWVVNGSADLDLFSYDVARYHKETTADPLWVKNCTHESYAKTYAIVFPHDEMLAGRGKRKSGVFDDLRERGCVFQGRHGMERPGWFEPASDKDLFPKEYDYYGAYADGAWRVFEDSEEEIEAHEEHPYHDLIKGECTFDVTANFDLIKEECRAAREGVAIFDQSYFGNFFLEGEDAYACAQMLCGSDLKDKAVGSVTYTVLCNKNGGVEADLTVAKLAEDQWYFSAGGQTCSKDFWWIEKLIENKGYNCSLRNTGDDITLLSVQGPHSRTLLNKLIGDDDSIENEDLPFSHCKTITVAGVELNCLRLTFIGELGFELHVDSDKASRVYQAVRKAGEEYEKETGVPVRDAGYYCIDSLSAEKNFRHYHADLSNQDTPLQAGIGFTVLSKLKKDDGDADYDFIGREALQAHRKAGLQRKLICLTVDKTADDKPVILNGMETIWRNGECIGLVQVAAFGHTIDKTIVYGYIDCPADQPKITNKWLNASESWHVGDRGNKLEANLSLKAPFDPKNTRINGVTGSE